MLKLILLVFAAILIYSPAYSQSTLKLFNIEKDNYPNVKSKYFIFTKEKYF